MGYKNEIPSASPFTKGSALQQKQVVIKESPPLQKGEQGGFKKASSPPLYWSATKVEHAWRYELAGNLPITDWAGFARTLLCQQDDAVNWAEYLDSKRQTYRAARFVGGQLESCLFISTATGLLPPRDWLVSLFAQENLTPADRSSLLSGKPLIAGEDKGRTVCACFNVGEKTIRKAIAEQGLQTVEEIGRCLQAGTNCGSCVPELKALLEK